MSHSSDAETPRAGGRHGKPWRAAGAVVVVIIGLLGAGLVGVSLVDHPDRPPQPAAGANPPGTATLDPDLAPADAGSPALPRSAPTTVTIPRIGVDAEIMSLGVDPDGMVQVPPLEQARLAGWYSRGPSPGEVGNAVLVGHVDSVFVGPAVFFSIGALLPGDIVTVGRSDGTSVDFRVDAVRSYPKTQFPSELVYGANDRAGLRLVTCGGRFDEATGDYPDNVVVFATLVP